MNLHQLKKLALEKMQEHNLIQNGWRFEFDNRSVRRLGFCSHHTKTIALSSKVFARLSEEEALDTILHEIAHALMRGHAHDAAWKAKAKEIGCRAEATCNLKHHHEVREVVYSLMKWTGVCPNGHEVHKFRKPKYETSCAICAPKFDRNFIFTFSLK